MLSTYIVASVLAAMCHELGHLCCARVLGIKVKRAGIGWRGPYIVREPGTDIENLAITLAGPLANLLLAASLTLYVLAVGGNAVCFALINLALGLFNLLPVPSSDGARILHLLLAGRKTTAAA